MVIANKRLCNKAEKETRELVKEMCALVEDKCPEFKGLLVPMCEYNGWVCHEMKTCGHIFDEWTKRGKQKGSAQRHVELLQEMDERDEQFYLKYWGNN